MKKEIVLKYADYEGSFYGFHLKKGYFYGEDMETNQKVAVTGWEIEGNVAIYYLESEKWVLHWIDPIYIAKIENLPKIREGKLSFQEWLKEENISNEEYEEDWEIVNQNYDYYYYDGLPQFVIDFIEKD